jgi:predicted  nucleic acid-binding Zn-ribbon protein
LKKEELNELETNLSQKKGELEEKETEVNQLEDEIKNSRIRKERALELYEGLSGEEQKWVYFKRILAKVYYNY